MVDNLEDWYLGLNPDDATQIHHYVWHLPCAGWFAEYFDGILRCWNCGEIAPQAILDAMRLSQLKVYIPKREITSNTKDRWFTEREENGDS